MKIREANLKDLDNLSKVFTDYLFFAGNQKSYEDSKLFLKERLDKKDCVMFIALIDNQIVGFTQLFPFFGSASLEEIWILNAIYIEDTYRQQGVAQSLLSEAIFYSKKTNKKKVHLITKSDNLNSQALFEKFGFKKADFINYEFIIT